MIKILLAKLRKKNYISYLCIRDLNLFYMLGLKTMLLLGLGAQELLLIALVVLLLFGGAKIPELMRGMGKGVKSFKEGMKEVDEEVNKAKSSIAEDEK